MIFTRIFIVSLFIVYSNKYSFEECSEFLSNQTGLTNLSNILIGVFIKFKRKYEFRVFLKVAIAIIAMSAGAFCGVAPFLFRKKASEFQKRGGDERNENWKNGSSGGVGADFVSMRDIRNKISCLRDLLDFPPCLASATLLELLILTLSDIFQRYPEIKPVSEFRNAPFHKALKIFCDSLKSLGDLWTTEKWMVQCRYDSCMRLENTELERIALFMLEDIIPVARERLFNEMDDDDYDDYSPPSNPFSKALFDTYSDTSSFPGSPMTPTSVLPGSSEKGSYSPPVVLPIRVQAVGKLSPIDMKRLSFHMLPHIRDPKLNILLQQSDCQDDVGEMEMIDVVIHTTEMETRNASFDQIVNVLHSPRSLPKLPSYVADQAVPLPLLQPMLLPENEPVSPTHDRVVSVPFPPPPPPLTAPRNLAIAPPPPPPPQQSHPLLPMALENCPPPPPPPPTGTSASSEPLMSTGPSPAPPPPPMRGNGAALPPPPPPTSGASMPKGSGSAPPPPPGAAGLRTKKLSSKLKRSSQMSNLYRTLKGKVEGSSSPVKSPGRKSKVGGASAGGKQGMADALAEMTKRSSYFMQIEEDVKTYEGMIKELKTAIASFQTSDMAELLKFRKHVESHLEKLTDETQVLARFEEFPSKKLEAIRMASALHLKLDSIITTLENWQIVGPVGKLLDKAEGCFSKIKVELDALERTKDEDMKRFQAQKINFDFGLLMRIKELMVDVSSNCMELALKERRQAMSEGKNGTAKILWRAFQFAFRVYTFAGGHDDRADELTREVAHEIETQN